MTACNAHFLRSVTGKVPTFKPIIGAEKVRTFVDKWNQTDAAAHIPASIGDIDVQEDAGEAADLDEKEIEVDAGAEDVEDDVFDEAIEVSFLNSHIPEVAVVRYPWSPYADDQAILKIKKTKKATLDLKAWIQGGKGQANVGVELEHIPDAELLSADLVNLRTEPGRLLSRKEWDVIGDKDNSTEELLSTCLKQMTQALDDMCFGYYKDSIEEFAEMTKRNETAANAASNFTGFRLYSPVLLFDNWIHCRTYLVALCRWQADAVTTEAVSVCEHELAMVLSMIRLGAEDPTPWLLVVDYILRKLWRAIPAFKREASFIKNLFEELATFAHGTALTAFVIRCPRKSSTTATLLTQWYPLLREYDPRCANRDCRALLPDLSAVTTVLLRGMFSFGTLEARVGKRGLRAMVSTNRDNAFNCLYTITKYWAPNKDLVPVIFWYSALFHNATCKMSQGKPAITPFA